MSGADSNAMLVSENQDITGLMARSEKPVCYSSFSHGIYIRICLSA
jgi:hypothetical protein